jgi:hypothetical protein
MTVSRVVLLVAAACFAAGSFATAQSRGNGPAGRGPQITGGGSGSNVSGGRTGRGEAGNGAIGRGNSGEARGDAGGPPAHVGAKAGDDRRGNARRDERSTDDNGGANSRSGGGPGNGKGKSVVANMNPRQRARLETMLPSGMTLEQAAEGFRSQGQFIAALQQSDKHNVSFVDLKSEMTADTPLSLGQAMRKLGVETDED